MNGRHENLALIEAIVAAGYVRCPNSATRWYHSWAGAKRPEALVDIHVTDAIYLVRCTTMEPVAEFPTVEALQSYLEQHGKVIEPGLNVWD